MNIKYEYNPDATSSVTTVAVEYTLTTTSTSNPKDIYSKLVTTGHLMAEGAWFKCDKPVMALAQSENGQVRTSFWIAAAKNPSSTDSSAVYIEPEITATVSHPQVLPVLNYMNVGDLRREF